MRIINNRDFIKFLAENALNETRSSKNPPHKVNADMLVEWGYTIIKGVI